jgi:hypothetical protein
MNLNLRYAPTPENAAKFADDMVCAAADISGVELDYSVAGLKDVDEIIEGFRQDGCTPDQIAETLFGFGCYVGEVLVQHAGGRWRSVVGTPDFHFAGCPLVIDLGDKRWCNPIGKVFKRLENGEEDGLPYFYQVFATHT